MSQPLNADSAAMASAAAALENIAGDVLTALGRYSTMNGNLTGAGFVGDAAMASMATTEDISNTGRQVHDRFQTVINMVKKSGHEYAAMNDANRSTLSPGAIST
ncbi:hypothetical protein [Mycobacterium simiae]|uniref:hypothetical protein n=1 Tax=Mycobacterium simiae TaxID=1784 RepID=UPI002607B85F|nr:hypothetical protein [Mycobacterium simiae]